MANLDQRHWFFLGMKAIMLALLDTRYTHIGAKLRILDAGAGTCWFTQALGRYGQVTALDIEKDALQVCERRGIEKILQGDVARIPVANASFDLLVCSEVLYHKYVKDDSAAIREFNRILEHGGRVLVKVPAHNYLWGGHDSINLTRKRYEPEEIRKLFVDSGFIIERITYANFFLFPVVYIKRKLERVIGATPASDIAPTFSLLNFILLSILRFEATLLRYIDFPQGSSIICLGRKR